MLILCWPLQVEGYNNVKVDCKRYYIETLVQELCINATSHWKNKQIPKIVIKIFLNGFQCLSCGYWIYMLFVIFMAKVQKHVRGVNFIGFNKTHFLYFNEYIIDPRRI